jgi:hypothetical protein
MRSLHLLFFILVSVASAAHSEKPVLFAAAGKADISPDVENQTIWLAGYGASGRRAVGVRDPLNIRATVLSDGRKTIAMVAVDSIGIYREDVLDIRKRLGWDGHEDKYLFLAATHDHSAPDMLGLWGRFPGVSGVHPAYHEKIKSSAVELVKKLSGQMVEADMYASSSQLNPQGLCRDSRDPVVIDPELNVLQFKDKKGKIIGTIVRWSCHPEAMGDTNYFATADYPGAMCALVEAKTGGACSFFPGSIGGLMNPHVDHDANVEDQFVAMKELGRKIGLAALSSMEHSADRFSSAEISFESEVVRLPVENSRYILFLRSLTFGHKIFDRTGRLLPKWKTYWYPLRHLIFFPLPEAMRPWIETEASLLRIGPVKILGVPGELFPELAIGGYAGEHTYGYPPARQGNKNPPDLKAAPKPPYLRESLKAKHGWIVGLANDEIGYIIPPYDFQATPTRSMTPKPAGTHYEETNSTGERAAPILLEAYRKMLAD